MNKIDLKKVDLNLLLMFETLMRHGSVSKAAIELGRTQSAVSHALGRLRAQLGDPLLVKTNGRMQASPYALELMQEIYPILRSIERVLSPKEPFYAHLSTRRFRIAVPDLVANFFPRLIRRVQETAPNIQIDWEAPNSTTLLDVAEGLVDLALLPNAIKRPEGVNARILSLILWGCFMRKGHPALRCWDKEQWSSWPHIIVGTGNHLLNPVSDAAKSAGMARKVALVVPTFGSVAPLLAQTNMIATLPIIALSDVADHFSLQACSVPFHIPDMPHALVWSARLNNDPANQWLRECFSDTLRERMSEEITP